MVSAFSDNNPRGFGLCQRDRVFDHYLDGVNYDRRPTLWVEPLPSAQGEGWGKGSIQLCEIPTDDEIHDNIVAMWVPEKPVPAGAELTLDYRLYWVADEPFPPKLGRVRRDAARPRRPARPAAAEGRAQVRGRVPRRPAGDAALWRQAGNGRSPPRAARCGGYRIVEAVPDDVPGHWRVEFDLTVDGADPVEMRCFLQAGGQTLTETWMFQYHPF